jgi:isoaspartyl peptidase/L-asparaginase-like protein (Ntn-hydrolase superfamily)
MSWMIIATWKFSAAHFEDACRLLAQGGAAEDAAQRIAVLVEDDPSIDSVGLGGCPNIHGEMELDAAMMNGDDLSIGAVAAIKGIRNPISLARLVMEKSANTLLVGEGAEEFAAAKRLECQIMLTNTSIDLWRKKMMQKRRNSSLKNTQGHDTIGIVVMDISGHMVTATSTSGLALKHRGRVGDSPLVGSGYYVDSHIGGATATGVGEDIMKGCMSFLAVQLMEQGYSPQAAAEAAVLKTHMRLKEHRSRVGQMAIICADNKGGYGGAANHNDFYYVAASEKHPTQVIKVKSIVRKMKDHRATPLLEVNP